MHQAVRLAISAALLIVLRLQAQTPIPQASFRAGTDLVQVDVSVLDGKRRPVRGLTAADFTIFEDGQPRDIHAFSKVYLAQSPPPRDVSWTREVLESAKFSEGDDSRSTGEGHGNQRRRSKQVEVRQD